MTRETRAERRLLQALDFTPQVSCEERGHGTAHEGGNADWYEHAQCPVCRVRVGLFVCETRRQEVLRATRMRCPKCKSTSPRESWHHKFARVTGRLP